MVNLMYYRSKIDEIIHKDYDHETPDIPRSKEYCRAISHMLKSIFPDYTIIPTKGCYCESSGFIQKNGKFVYYSFNDYRYDLFGKWYERILIRTAQNEHDYTGGPNHYADLDNLRYEVDRLFY